MTTGQHQGARPGTGPMPAPVGTPVQVTGTRQRYPRWLIWFTIAAMAIGALGAAWLWATAADRDPVVALSNPVPYGQQITAGDLREGEVPSDTDLAVVSWDQRDSLIGQLAATDLREGQLATPDAVMTEAIPGEGNTIVGIPVKRGQAPATPLQPRDKVLIVTAGVPSAPGGGAITAGEAVEGTVLRVGRADESGLQVVDVIVPRRAAEAVAQVAGTGQSVLVILPRS